MNAIVLTIGNELLQGFTIDTNSTWLGTTLLPYGINITKKISVGDNIQNIISEAKIILNGNYDYLFVTGGLGPTHDDITKDAFKELLNDELIFDKNYYIQLKSFFDSKSIKMSKNNRSQAMLCKTADIIPNEIGTALGMHFYKKNTHIFILPGVPREMKKMVNNYILPKYINIIPKQNFITIKTVGITESHLAEKINDLIIKYSDSFQFAFLPHYSGVSFRIYRLNEKSNLSKISNIFFKAMQPYAYGLNDDTLEKIVSQKLINNKLSIAVAESCTGGLISKLLTDIPGSSRYFCGGVTAYSNQMKKDILNVNNDTMKSFGAVSKEVALEMANGIRNNSQADIGVSTTGISGPDGSTKTKSVGLVYIGFVSLEKSFVKQYNYNYSREIHRLMTATAALNITRLELDNIN